MSETAKRCFVCAEKRNVIFACEKMRNAVLQSPSNKKIILIAPEGIRAPARRGVFLCPFLFRWAPRISAVFREYTYSTSARSPCLVFGYRYAPWVMAAAYASMRCGETALCPVHSCKGNTAACALDEVREELSLCGQVSEKDMSVRAGMGMPAGSADLCTGKLQNTGGAVSTKSAFFIPKCTNFSRFSTL